MNISDLRSIKIFKIEDDMRGLKVGDIFLMGDKMIAQGYKKPGDEISFYEVINVSGNNVEYVFKVENLEL